MKIRLIIFLIAVFFISSLAGYFLGFLFQNNTETENNNIYQTATAVNEETDKSEKTNKPELRAGLHYSFFNKKEFYDGAFERIADKTVPVENKAEGMVVNHHLLAADIIAKAFQNIAFQKPSTVVIISPNHFSAGKDSVISSLYDWQTPYGVFEVDGEIIKKMREDNILGVEESPFAKEHGISNIVAFAKKTFPGAKFIPIIIKDAIGADMADKFASRLNEILPEDVLVIISADFSHYLPVLAADFHDEKSMAVLSGFDYNGAELLDTDSKPAIRILLKYLEARGAKHFTLFDHSNSARISDKAGIAETTSYITGVFSAGDIKPKNTATILAFGDLMLDRNVRKTIDDNFRLYPFEYVERLFEGNDITLANLEGPFTNNDTKSLGPNNMTFTFDPAMIPVLKRLGFSVFSLANNHSLNFGQKGFTESKKHLDEEGIGYFGDSLNKENLSVIKNVRGMKIGFVAYNEFSYSGTGSVISEIKSIKERSDFVVVYSHWGSEYQTEASGSQRKKAHEFIDAGADIVLGSHPHVVQPMEIYNNKAIFYSLGNFLFDQSFSWETMHGLGIGIVFGVSQIDFYFLPIEIKSARILFAGDKDRDIILNRLTTQFLIPENMKKQILSGKLSINY